VRTVVPGFEALAQVQDKLAAFTTLTRLGLPQAPTSVITGRHDLASYEALPVFVKTPIAPPPPASSAYTPAANTAAPDLPLLLGADQDALVQADAIPFTGHPERSVGQDGKITWSEGLESGYRWYADQGVKPLFPFGYGLSYTTFGHSGLKATAARTAGSTSATPGSAPARPCRRSTWVPLRTFPRRSGR
jgi:hypothetical protein